MTGYLEWRIIAALILLLFSAFFAVSESAFFSILGSGAIVGFEKTRPRLAGTIREMLASPGRLISSILVGNEVVNIIISVLIASVFAGAFLHADPGHRSFWVGTLSAATSTGLILIFGEVIPKTLGVRFYRQLAGFIATPLYWFNKLIFPVEYLFRRISEITLWILGIKIGGKKKFKQEEFAELVEAGEEEGVLEETEYALLKNVFAFGDLTAAEVMTPKHEIFSLPLEMDYAEVKRKFLESGFSRVPIYSKTPESIDGILAAKDILKLDLSANKSIAPLLRRPFGVPPQKRLDDLLRDFLGKNIHMALVVNEYGEVMGLITLEDLLEEIFGETAEEPEEEELIEAGENRWMVSGRMEIRAFNEKMETLLYAPGIKTIAGYLLNEFGRVPAVDEEIVREGFCFRVKEIRRRQIHRIEVEKTHA
jgi:CBS domain containing-hemolysin-like protein